MSLSKPLSYESLKSVLEHMEPNQRFQAAKHCPSIRSTEKLVPLKLRTLHLDEFRLKVNDTTYQLRSCRKYPEGVTVPEAHRIAEKHDLFLDKYGAPYRPSVPFFSMSGDLDFGQENRNPTASVSQPTDEEIIDEYWRKIDLCERKIATWKANGLFDKVGPGKRIAKYLNVRLQPFLNRQDKILPEYEVVEQLVISSSHSKQVKYIDPDLQTWEIMKNLTTFLFGGRRDSIEVNHLYFSDKIQTAVCLPPGVQFKVRELTASASQLDVCEPIIDARSYPLQRLVERDLDNVEGSHPFEQTVKERIICGFEGFLLSRVSMLPNSIVHIQEKALTIEEIVEVFENICRQWKNREIGTRFSFQVKNSSICKLMDRLFRASEEFGGVRSGERLVRVPLNHFSEIRLTFESVDNITVLDDSFDHEDMGSHQDGDAGRAELNAVWREIFVLGDEEADNIEANNGEDTDRTTGILIIRVVVI